MTSKKYPPLPMDWPTPEMKNIPPIISAVDGLDVGEMLTQWTELEDKNQTGIEVWKQALLSLRLREYFPATEAFKSV